MTKSIAEPKVVVAPLVISTQVYLRTYIGRNGNV